MIKNHGIEDHLLDQIKKHIGISCFIEDFIEQAHQFGMLDEKRTANMRDNHWKMQNILNNGEVK